MDRTKKAANKHIFVYAILLQLLAVAVCIPLHRIFIHLGGLLQEPAALEETTDPTLGRFIYIWVAAAAAAVLSVLASRTAKADSTRALLPFLYGCLAGTFLWQCLGEDLWHFTFGGVRFQFLESISVLPAILLLIVLLLYCMRNNSLDWGVWSVILAFLVNWFGHYTLTTIYVLFDGLCSQTAWYRCIGLIVGIAGMAAGLFLGLKTAKKPKQKILAAVLFYAAFGLLSTGMIHGFAVMQ